MTNPAVANTLYNSPLRWVIMFAPLLMVFAFGAALNRLSVSAATGVFYAFAALMGVSISSIFLVYTGVSIVQTFLVTAIAFAGLSLWGYTTKKDLSGWGHVPADGPDRPDRRVDREHLHRLLGHAVRDLGHRRADLCGPDRL